MNHDDALSALLLHDIDIRRCACLKSAIVALLATAAMTAVDSAAAQTQLGTMVVWGSPSGSAGGWGDGAERTPTPMRRMTCPFNRWTVLRLRSPGPLGAQHRQRCRKGRFGETPATFIHCQRLAEFSGIWNYDLQPRNALSVCSPTPLLTTRRDWHWVIATPTTHCCSI